MSSPFSVPPTNAERSASSASPSSPSTTRELMVRDAVSIYSDHARHSFNFRCRHDSFFYLLATSPALALADATLGLKVHRGGGTLPLTMLEPASDACALLVRGISGGGRKRERMRRRGNGR